MYFYFHNNPDQTNQNYIRICMPTFVLHILNCFSEREGYYGCRSQCLLDDLAKHEADPWLWVSPQIKLHNKMPRTKKQRQKEILTLHDKGIFLVSSQVRWHFSVPLACLMASCSACIKITHPRFMKSISWHTRSQTPHTLQKAKRWDEVDL